MQFLILGGWFFLLLGAVLMPRQAIPWISGMTLPLVGAGFFWGPRGAFLISLGSVFACVGLVLRGGVALAWFAGPLMVFSLFPVILWSKSAHLRTQTTISQNHLTEIKNRVEHLQEEIKDQRTALHSQEQAISEISDLYGLSKQFLATLDWEQALRITEEALEKALPQMSEQQRTLYLKKVRSQIEGGELSMESLVSELPAGCVGLDSWDHGGIIIGQLALGLKRVSLYRQVQESALHDGLTGLLVRRHFYERFGEEVARATRRGTSLVFLMVDLDHFKRINDSYGHLVGDLVLREVARLIQSSVREVDLVGRYGGEEFGVVLPEASRPLGIQIAGRIREAVSRVPIQAYDEKVQITVSIGVALYPEDAANADLLIEQADQAMYEAKDQGRNRIVTVGGDLKSREASKG